MAVQLRLFCRRPVSRSRAPEPEYHCPPWKCTQSRITRFRWRAVSTGWVKPAPVGLKTIASACAKVSRCCAGKVADRCRKLGVNLHNDVLYRLFTMYSTMVGAITGFCCGLSIVKGVQMRFGSGVVKGCPLQFRPLFTVKRLYCRGKLLHNRIPNNDIPFANATNTSFAISSRIHWESDNPLEPTTEY